MSTRGPRASADRLHHYTNAKSTPRCRARRGQDRTFQVPLHGSEVEYDNDYPGNGRRMGPARPLAPFAKNDADPKIWLWDFAGQVDYRLVHQIFMGRTAAAVLVFKPQKRDPFRGPWSLGTNDLFRRPPGNLSRSFSLPRAQ